MHGDPAVDKGRMDGIDGAFSKNLPGRPDGESLAVAMKNLVTVGTGDNNMADIVSDQPVPHIRKPGQECVLPSQIMRGFMTAVQHHAKKRDILPEPLID